MPVESICHSHTFLPLPDVEFLFGSNDLGPVAWLWGRTEAPKGTVVADEGVRGGQVPTAFISFPGAEIVGKVIINSQFSYAFFRRQRTSFPLSDCLYLSLSLLDLCVEREVDVHRDKDIRMRLRKEIGSISFLEDANKPLETLLKKNTQ